MGSFRTGSGSTAVGGLPNGSDASENFEILFIGGHAQDLANSRREWLARLLRVLAWPSVTRFAEISAIFDDYVTKFGFNDAMRRIIPYFVNDLRVWGQSNVPQEGPLLIIANHPGTYDSIAISAALPRNDLKIIAGGYPFLRNLPAAANI
jgi:hypothetical protein